MEQQAFHCIMTLCGETGLGCTKRLQLYGENRPLADFGNLVVHTDVRCARGSLRADKSNENQAFVALQVYGEYGVCCKRTPVGEHKTCSACGEEVICFLMQLYGEVRCGMALSVEGLCLNFCMCIVVIHSLSCTKGCCIMRLHVMMCFFSTVPVTNG